MERLTIRQRKFVEEYLASGNFNATQAAIAAGYSRSGAHVEASRLLKTPKICEELAKRRREMNQESQVTREAVLAAIWDEARNARNDGARVTALGLLARHFGLFEADNEQRRPLAALPRETVRLIEARLLQLVQQGDQGPAIEGERVDVPH